jgi:hypothetical protein
MAVYSRHSPNSARAVHRLRADPHYRRRLDLLSLYVVPEVLGRNNVQQFAFGGTSILIVVNVTMDTVAQIQTTSSLSNMKG